MAVIELNKVNKHFGAEHVLRDVTLDFHLGTSTALVGRSGSGKSTLLNIMAVLTRPDRDKGRYVFEGKTVESRAVNDASAIEVRRRTGYISQGSDLLQNFSLTRNVEIALEARGGKVDSPARGRLDELLRAFKLDSFRDKLPSNLSGGQRQRANIVRALFCQPVVLFADEPTGALDVHNSNLVIETLVEQVAETGTVLILVTHDPTAAARCQRQILLSDQPKHPSIYRNQDGISVADIKTFIDSGK